MSDLWLLRKISMAIRFLPSITQRVILMMLAQEHGTQVREANFSGEIADAISFSASALYGSRWQDRPS
jgi:hypothetical protein